MALTKFLTNVDNVQGLANQPTETPEQLKAIFDKSGLDIKTYINDTLTVESDAALLAKASIDYVNQKIAEAVIDPVDVVTNSLLADDIKVGSLATSTTTEKSSVIGVTNELNLTKLAKNLDTIESYTEKKSSTTGASGTVNLDLSVQNVFEVSPTGSVTFALTNIPASPKVCSFTLFINQPATAQALTFPASWSWAGGNLPDFTAVSKTSIVYGTTKDGGTRIFASAAVGFTT